MEKERYELLYDDIIYDNTEKCYIVSPNKSKRDCMKSIANLLNQQDARIKELESKLRASNSQLASSEFKYNELEKNYKKQEDLLSLYLKICSELNLENQQLKQQLADEEKSHDLCIDSFNEECEKLRKQIKFESDARKRFKQAQNENAIEDAE